MATMAQPYQSQKIHPNRIIIGIALFIVLLLIAWAVRTHTNHTSAPARSTNQAQPNIPQNVPPTGQVNQGANPNQDTTPSQNGTNGNEMSSQ